MLLSLVQLLLLLWCFFFFFFSSRRRHTRLVSDWSSDVCSSDLVMGQALGVPVWQLLGGRFRDRVPAYANGWYQAERDPRSEERRVGKECRSRGGPYE